MIERPARRYGILGAARSGLAVAGLLRSEGAQVLVSDLRSVDELSDALETLTAIGARFEFGGHTEELFDNDEIVLSPGVPDTIPIVVEARRRGITITNELEIASRRCRAPMVAITGTNGKTTTTELVGHLFRTAGWNTWVAGNVGIPFSEIAPKTLPEDVVVVEASSFQLEHIETFHPRVAVILNITPDHMDRYATFDRYVAAKRRITMRQTADDLLIYNNDDPALRDLPSHTSARTQKISLQGEVDFGACVRNDEVHLRTGEEGGTSEGDTRLIPIDRIGIRGPHNLYNAMASALVARAFGLDDDTIRDGLKTFAGVPHRLEPVAWIDGVQYVNDSKATNVNSLWYALQSFPGPIVLIAGGRSKKNDYTTILPLLSDHVRVVVLIGEAADEMEAAFGGIVPTRRAGFDLEAGIRMARGEAHEGDVVLLSPACASFDMFNNYEHRGEMFKTLVVRMSRENQETKQ